jgi:hypothetical protein
LVVRCWLAGYCKVMLQKAPQKHQRMLKREQRK